MKRKIRFVAAIAGAVLVGGGSSYAQTREIAHLSTPGASDAFGASVAIDGDYLVVGAPYDDQMGQNTGATHVFRRWGTDWVELDKLVPADGAWGDTFGHAVATHGDWVVVGAPQLEIDFGGLVGAVYVFRRDENVSIDDWTDDRWLPVAKLTVLTPAKGDLFGLSVAIHGDVIAAGRVGFYEDPGAVEVYRWNGSAWAAETTVTNAAAGLNRAFGARVAVSGEAMVVGAPGRGSTPAPGAAYVYRRHDGLWQEETNLSSLTTAVSNSFGRSVAIAGDVAVVGGYVGRMTAHLFRRQSGAWLYETALQPVGSDISGAPDAVALGDDLVAVGNPRDDDGANAAGAVYLFHREGADWSPVGKLLASNPFFDAGLGDALSAADVFLAAGAFEHAYVFLTSDSVSLRDYADFQNCFTDGEGPVAPGCEAFDVPGVEGAVDLRDYDRFLRTFVGP
jgi:hypothetical protein